MKYLINNILLQLFGCTLLFSCHQEKGGLPILGPRMAQEKIIGGTQVTDTIYHTISDFTFTNQDGAVITQQNFKNKIYIADFFFTTCPTICPVMKRQLLRVYEKYKNIDDVVILSHTIDPEHDSVAVLKDYAARLEVSSSHWQFVTGQKDSIYKIAQNYLVSAQEDKGAPGGFIHSGAFILIDRNRRIRGYYDGTEEEKVTQLLKDIDVLLDEK